jgi:hypothetical protein
MISRSTTVLAFGALALSACASTPGAKPADMSTAQHEQAAASHEGESSPHLAAFDPNAKQTKEMCTGRAQTQGACWTSVTNPTEAHKADAEKHRKMAADHRAASKGGSTGLLRSRGYRPGH